MATLTTGSGVRRIVVGALVLLIVFPIFLSAQQAPVYVCGSVNLVTQTRFDAAPLGGTVRGGSVVFGVQVSSLVAIEFEPSFSFGEPYSWEYTYQPGPTRTAHVVASRRDSFYSFQLRTRAGVIEPVAGLSYVRGKVGRHATIGGTTYFDDSRTDHGLAVVGGLDAAVRLTQHFHFVPAFRLLARFPSASGDPLGEQTRTGSLTLRYGAGVRVTF